MRLLHRVNLLACFCLVSLIINLLENASAQHFYEGHSHLEPIIQNFSKRPNFENIQSSIDYHLLEHSDLIRNLQEKRIHNDFLPYIAEYEDLKGSSINPHVRIFFYDESKLPLDHFYQTVHLHGVCYPLFNFVFINIDYWSTLASHSILSIQKILSVLEGHLNGEINQLPTTLSYIPNRQYPEHYLGFVPPDKDKNAESFIKHFARSEESMPLTQKIEFIRSFIRSAKHKDERKLSYQEKLTRRHFIRRSMVFHELGHCDLNLKHESTNDSIMNETTAMEKIIDERYPNSMDNDDLNAFFNDLISDLFLERDALHYDDSLWTRIRRWFGFSPPEPTEAEEVFELLEALNEIETLANTSSLLD